MPNEEDRKWLYGQFKDNGYDTGSYEDFVKSLDSDDDFEWWHNEATSLGLEVGDLDEFGSLFRTPKQAGATQATPSVEDGIVPDNFDDEPDMRPLNKDARKRVEKEQRRSEKEAEKARIDAQKSVSADRKAYASMSPQERRKAFNEQFRQRQNEKIAADPYGWEAERQSIEEQNELARQDLAAEKRAKMTAENAAKENNGVPMGNESYSAEEAESAAREYAEIAPELGQMDARVQDFNRRFGPLEEKIKQINEGKLQLSPEEQRQFQNEYSQYLKESEGLSLLAKKYDSVLNSGPGKEYKEISERMTALSNGERTADSVWEYAQEYAKLQRNPIYRASMGENAPSEDEIGAGVLQAQCAYLEERMKGAKGDERKELKKAFSDAKEALYANPWYRKHIDTKIAENQSENEAIGLQRAEYVQQLRDGYRAQGIDPNYWWQMEKGDPELQRLDAAAHMHDDAINEYRKPTKYDDSKGMRNVGSGLKGWAKEQAENPFGMVGFTEDIAVVRPVLEKVEKIAGNVNEDDIINEGYLDELEKQLTPGELAVLDAYFEKVGAQSAKGADTAIGYQIGQTVGDMVNLGLEMIATGGVGGAVRKGLDKAGMAAMKKLMTKRLYRKFAKTGVGRVALWGTHKVGRDILETAVRLPFMGSTYKAIGEGAVELSSDYKTRDFMEYAPEKTFDQFVEQLTEVSNGFAFPLFGKIMKTPGMGKFVKGVIGENGQRAMRAFMERGEIKLLDDAMIGSFGGEWEEELLGATIHSITDDPNALRDFFSAEQQLVLLGSLAPIPIARGTVGGVRLAVPAAKAGINWNRAQRELERLGFDEGRIARLKEVMDNAPAPEGAREIMTALRDAGMTRQQAENSAFGATVMEQGNEVLAGTIPGSIDKEAYGALARYFWSAQQKRAAGLMASVEEDRKVAAKRAELESALGTFYHNDADGREVVETATMLDAYGNPMNIFITSDAQNANGEMAYVSEAGTGFVTPDRLVTMAEDGSYVPSTQTDVMPVNEYLAALVMNDARVREAQAVEERVAVANQTVRQQVEALQEIKHSGKDGSLRSPDDGGAWFYPDDESAEPEYVTWDDLASENGIETPVVETPEEEVIQEADQIALREQAKNDIYDAVNTALNETFNEAVVETEAGPANVTGIMLDTIDPDEGTAMFTVVLPDGSRDVTTRIPIEPVLAQLRGEEAPAEPAPVPEPAGEVGEEPAEEPVEEAGEGEGDEQKPKIPLDAKGEPIYDAPGVSVADALEAIYSTEGITEEMGDTFIINRAKEAEKGRNPKQGKMSLRQWGEATTEANRKADFWAELRKFAEGNQKAREEAAKKEAERQALIEKYGVDTSGFDLTPMTLEEAVAAYLGGDSVGLINLDDAIRETLGKRKDNRVPTELFRHLGKYGILTKNGGSSVQAVADDIVRDFYGDLEHDEEADDARDYIIDFLLNSTKSDMRDFIFNKRLEQARAEAEAADASKITFVNDWLRANTNGLRYGDVVEFKVGTEKNARRGKVVDIDENTDGNIIVSEYGTDEERSIPVPEQFRKKAEPEIFGPQPPAAPGPQAPEGPQTPETPAGEGEPPVEPAPEPAPAPAPAPEPEPEPEPEPAEPEGGEGREGGPSEPESPANGEGEPPAPAAPAKKEIKLKPGDILLDDYKDIIDPWIIERLQGVGFNTAMEVLEADLGAVALDTDIDMDAMAEVYDLLRSRINTKPDTAPTEEKKKTKKEWMRDIEDVYKKLCERFRVPEDPIIQRGSTKRYYFDYGASEGYTLDNLKAYYEDYATKLNDPVEPATEKQMDFIFRLADEQEKAILAGVKFNKVSAGYAIDILKASSDAVNSRTSSAADFEEYLDELQKLADMQEREEQAPEAPENKPQKPSESPEKTVPSQKEEGQGEEPKPAPAPAAPQELTEEQIRNSGYPDEDIIDAAVDYVNGDKSFANAAAYKLIKDYVGSQRTATEQTGGNADGTQLDGADVPPAGMGAEPSGGQTRPVGGEGTPERVPGNQNGGVPSGEGGPSETAGGGLPSDAENPGGNDRGRRGGTRGPGRPHDDGGGQTETPSQPAPSDRGEIAAGSTDIDALGGELADLLSQFGSTDLSIDRDTRGLDAMSYSTAPEAETKEEGMLSRKLPKKATVPLSLEGLTPRQAELAGKIIFSSAKLGYAFVKTEGLATFNDFRRWFKSKFGDAVMKGLNYDESSLDAFIREVWNTKMKIDGSRLTLEKHASELHNAEVREDAAKTIPERIQLQKEANEKKATPVPGSRKSISETVPMLTCGQWDDLVAIERQFFDPSHDDYDHAYGKGMLITNGTGTGKTFTGLGTIKRFLDMGKKRILVVSPANMVGEWTSKAKLLGIDMKRLEDTKDKGEGVVATSYQNFWDNTALYEDEFDLIVYDECQYIIYNQAGEGKKAFTAHKRLTNKNVEEATDRIILGTTEIGRRKLDLIKESEALAREQKDPFTKENRQAEIVIRLEEIESEIESINDQLRPLRPKYREQAEKAVKKTKTLFLSATPFHTVQNLRYAEGYIFQTPKVYRADKTEVTDEDSRWSAFITEWFRGDEPMDEKEYTFGDHLLDELETTSFRELENGYDNSRDFPDVSGNVMAARFNVAWEAILKDPRFNALKDAAETILKDRTWTTQLFETMKVSAMRDRLKEHLDAGRKIVIFHDRMHESASGGTRGLPPVGPPFAAVLDYAMNNTQGTPPIAAIMAFRSAFADILRWEQTLDYRPVPEQIIDLYATDADRAEHAKKMAEYDKKVEEWQKECDEFVRKHPTWTPEQLAKKMPKAPKRPALKAESVATFNGEMTPGEKEKAKDAFNSDEGKVRIICVTTASGGAGLSLHDTTGKFPRVLIQTALPNSPIGFIQAEGRIFRWGNKSNAVFEYPRLGINLEAWVFAQTFNAKAETVENLAHGFRGRGLKDSIMTGFYENSGNVPIDGQGIGGVEMDKRGSTLKGMAKAKHDYGVAVRKGIRDNDPSVPEPLGFKMTEWARCESGDTMLVPFAGRGSIARYAPKGVAVNALEEDTALQADLMVTSGGNDFKLRDGSFTEFGRINKADVVMLNGASDPGMNAAETMRKGFLHLSEGGRLIAVLPDNGEADFTISDLANMNGVVRGTIKVSGEAIGKGAGTYRIVILDKITKQELKNKAGKPFEQDLSESGQEELFSLIEKINAPERIVDKQAIAIKKIKAVLTDMRKNDLVDSITISDEEKSNATIWFDMKSRLPKGMSRSKYRIDALGDSTWYYYGKFFSARYSEFLNPGPNSQLIKAYQWLKEVVEITDPDQFRRKAGIESGAKDESIELMRELYRQYMRFIRAGFGLTETQIQRVAQGLRPDVSAADIDTLNSYEELRAKFEITNHDDQERLDLYQKVAKVGEQIGLKIGAGVMDRTTLGGYNNVTNSLTINKIRWNGLSDDVRATTLLHEFIHSVTVYAIAGYDTNAPGMSDELYEAAKLACDVFEQVKKGLPEDVRPFTGQYSIENAKEFLAEMANPETREKMKNRRMWVTRTTRGVRVSGAEMEGAEQTDAWTLMNEALDGMLKHFDKALFDRFKGRISDFVWSVDRNGFYTREADGGRSDQRNGNELVRNPNATEDGTLFRTSGEIAAEYPNWMDDQTSTEVEGSQRGQNTQVAGTVGTYRKVGDWIDANYGKDARILDASSGLGLGTLELRGRGFDVDDIEPYPGKGRRVQPTYGGESAYQDAIEEGNEYDYIISNAVLNVIPDDWRADVLHNMARLLAPGGRMFINTRKAGEEKTIKNKIELDSPQEVLVGTPERINSYQRFFTPAELKEYVERELGDGYTVEIANRGNSGTSGLAAVVVTKNGESRLNRRGENLRNPIDRARAVVKINDLAKKLGVKFEQDSSLKAKGAFSPKTGRIRINIDAHKDTNDLEATLLHEAVAHYGLRKIFGDDWAAVRKRLYQQADPDIRKAVDEMAKRDGLSAEVAMEEYIAHLAEDGRFDQREESFWQSVVRAVRRLLQKIGFNSGYLTDEDFRALLFASYANMRTGGAIEMAANVATANALRKMASASHEDFNPNDGGPDGGVPTPPPAPESGDEMNNSPYAAPFYSNAEAALGRIKSEKATPEQWLRMLTNEGGMKAGEDKWLGLSDWLKSQSKKTLTKQEIAEYIAQNSIRIEEVNYAEGEGDTNEKRFFLFTTKLTDEMLKLRRERTLSKGGAYILLMSRFGEDYADYVHLDKYTGLIRPNEYVDPVEALRYFEQEVNESETREIDSTRIMYTTSGLDNKREIALTVPTIESWNETDEVHFGDAGEGRAVAWARFGDAYVEEGASEQNGGTKVTNDIAEFIARMAVKYDIDISEAGPEPVIGAMDATEQWQLRSLIANARRDNTDKIKESQGRKKVLVIDEIQSKRHQEGRENGYRPTKPEVDRLVNEQIKARQEEDAFLRHIYEKYDGETFDNVLYHNNLSGLSRKDADEITEIRTRLQEATQKAAEASDSKLVAPAPFEKNWHELAMKRMLRLAAEEGYDYVAWTTGDQQSERYNMSNVINGIETVQNHDEAETREVYLNRDGAPDIQLTVDKSGKVIKAGKYFDEFVGNSLSDLIGKELAEKTMATETDEIGNAELVAEGEELKVGGAGMRGFYDEILVRFMNKYGKKWGVKVSDITLPTLEEAGRVMHAVPVTSEMAESVLRGQPMFRKADLSDLPEDMRADVERMETSQETEELYRRNSEETTASTAADLYNTRVQTMGQALREAAVDEYAPVDALVDALVKESGKPLSDSERVSDNLRETGGKGMAAIRDYNENFLKPMWDAVAAFRMAAGNISIEETETYIGLKSGLERNVVFAKRDAKRDYYKQYEARIDELNKREKEKKAELDKQLKSGKISDVTYQAKLTALQQDIKQKKDDALTRLNGHIAAVDSETDNKYKEYRKKDYSAITAWAKNPDVAEAERLAKEHVDGLENTAGKDPVKELWKRINAATKETLKFQYEHDMLTKAQYQEVAKMLEYYVPMRGFMEDTAEDLYNYYVTSQNTSFMPTLLGAKGRKTMFESPLGNIGAMMSSAISQGVKNSAKLSLLYAVRNRPKNTIATVTRAWFVKNGQKDANGKDLYDVAYPQIPEGADLARREAIIEQFEKDMADKKRAGDAYNSHREVDLHGGVVAFEREAHKNEHMVPVREAGREYSIIINGNPSAAQAINGVKRGNSIAEDILTGFRRLTRTLSQMFTTFSVPFWVSNFQRDFGQGLTNTLIRNDAGYVGAYLANYPRAFKVFPMIVGKQGLEKRLAEGDPVAVMYKQYLDNGGPMGQSRVEDNEYFEKQMKRYLDNSAKTGLAKGAMGVLEAIGRVGEAVETVTRFSVFMTSVERGRPIHEAISDAKEVSTNFARKGRGRKFTKDELSRMRHADGSKLTDLEKGFVQAVSMGVEFFRATIPFFNAAVQGLENKGANYRKHFWKTLAADSIYFMAGFGMYMLRANSGDDDEKGQYSHISDYVRRNNEAIGVGGGKYVKWALPQEYRVCYALGDILGGYMKDHRPAEDALSDAFGSLMQLSPIGAVTDEVLFSGGDKQTAWENFLVGVAPGIVSPILEATFNRDFKGARLYNEGFNDNNRMYPGWTKALQTTGEEYVWAAEQLNKVHVLGKTDKGKRELFWTADDEQNPVRRGTLNLNPAVVEHLVESYFSGPYQIVVRLPEAVGKTTKGVYHAVKEKDASVIGDYVTVRDWPLLNRILLNTHDNTQDAYYSNMYYYFKEKQTEADRVFSAYKKESPTHRDEVMQTKDYAYVLVFKKYAKKEKQLRAIGKNAENSGNVELKDQMDQQVRDVHSQIASECLDIYYDRVNWQSWLNSGGGI